MVPADPEPGRLRLHVHLRRRHRREPRRATTGGREPERSRRPTASGARPCATTTTTASTATSERLGDGVDPNRNYPAKRGIDEEGATNSTASETYRGPYALSEPENLAVDRLQRRVKFRANINYHSAGQLLLTPVSYTTDYYPPDSTLFDAITGTDGDEAVFPYRSQHSSDLYESNGDTIDNAYMDYGIIGWTPEMDTCETLGEPQGCNQFASPDDEDKVQAVFNKNLQFALNVTNSLPNLGRPKNFDTDPSHYQVKPTRRSRSTASTSPTAPPRRSSRRRSARSRPGGRHHRRPAGRLQAATRARSGWSRRPRVSASTRSRATTSSAVARRSRRSSTDRALQANDVVRVTVKAGGLQQEFNYRIVATQKDTAKKRVLVVAAEDYTGKSPNVTPGYDTSSLPRAARLRAGGRRLRGRDLQHRRPAAPTVARRTASSARRSSTRPTSACSRTSTRSTTTRATTSPRRSEPTRARLTLARRRAARLATRPRTGRTSVMLELRDYANEGGKLVVDGRNAHQPFTSSAPADAPSPWPGRRTSCSASTTRRTTRGDDDLPGTAWLRPRQISNDVWQNYLGVVGRQGSATASPATKFDGAPVPTPRRPAACSRAWRRSRSTPPRQRPEPDRGRHRRPRWPSRRCACATGAASPPRSRCARRRRRPTTPRRRPRRPTVARSSRRVTP